MCKHYERNLVLESESTGVAELVCIQGTAGLQCSGKGGSLLALDNRLIRRPPDEEALLRPRQRGP